MVPFTPEHKVTFEQLSKDLQDRIKASTDSISELEKKIKDIKTNVNTIIDGKSSENNKKILDIKNKIDQYSKELNALIDQKARSLNNRKHSGDTTDNLFANGQDGQWAKIDPNKKNLFGDNAFDVLLVYNDITQQELDTLNDLSPTKIKEQYGVVVGHSQLVFDLDKRKVYKWIGYEYQEVSSIEANSNFQDYLMNRSFYLNPITKKLYFYYFNGKWCLIYGPTDSDIGKINGDTNTVVWDRLQPIQPNMPKPVEKPIGKDILDAKINVSVEADLTKGVPIKETEEFAQLRFDYSHRVFSYYIPGSGGGDGGSGGGAGGNGGFDSDDMYVYSVPNWFVNKITGVIDTKYGKVFYDVLPKDETLNTYGKYKFRDTYKSRQEQFESYNVRKEIEKNGGFYPSGVRIPNAVKDDAIVKDGTLKQHFTYRFLRIDNQGIKLPKAIFISFTNFMTIQLMDMELGSKNPVRTPIKINQYPLPQFNYNNGNMYYPTGEGTTGARSAPVMKIKFAICAYNSNRNNDNNDNIYKSEQTWEYKLVEFLNTKASAEVYLDDGTKTHYKPEQMIFFNDESKKYDTILIRLFMEEYVSHGKHDHSPYDPAKIYPLYPSSGRYTYDTGQDFSRSRVLLYGLARAELKIWTGISK